MTRIVLVFLAASLLCLGLTGLRVALLQQLAPPQERWNSPRPVKDPAGPRSERPIEYIARAAWPDPAREAAPPRAWIRTEPAPRATARLR